MYANVNPQTSRNGISKSYYSEIRFWEYSRNQNQIRQQRFMRINVTLERPNLYSYMKLGYSNLAGTVDEIDYSNAQLNQLITFSNVQWLQNTDLIICPEGYFKSTKDSTCYRQSLQTLSIVIYKTQSQVYVITPRFSTFRNFYSRDNSNSLFDYVWALTATDTSNQTNTKLFPGYFNPQALNQDLLFTFDQVTDKPGRYDFSLKVQDKNNWQDTQKSTTRLSAKTCANIYDSATQMSFIQMDLKSTRTVENAIFTYDYSECFDYLFDASSISFGLDIPNIYMLSTDHNATAKTITLRTTTQSDIPPNDYFNLIITATWRNPSDRNDILQYSLIYQCRFVAKLVITLTSTYTIATLGNTVTINYDAKLSNLNQAIGNRQYTLTWLCPAAIQSLCGSSPVTQPLKLNYDQVTRTGLQLWVPQNITLVGTTNFIQGDGTRYSYGSILVTWINLQPDGVLTQLSTNIVQNAILAFQFTVTQMTEDQIDLKWVMTPPIDNACLVNSFDRKQYVFNGTCLQLNTNYQLQVNLYYKNQTQLLNTRSTVLKVLNPPSGGTFSCSPTSGTGFITSVTCSASGWTVTSQPPRYQYFVQDSNGYIVAVSPISIFGSVSFVPPPSTKIILKVLDGSDQYVLKTLTATYSKQAYTNTTLSLISDNISKSSPVTYDTGFVKNMQWVAQFINSYQQLMPKDQALSYMQSIISGINQQTSNFNMFNSTDQKAYFIQGTFQIFYQLSNYSYAMDISSFNSMQVIIMNLMSQSSIFQSFVNNTDFQKVFFQVQANIIGTLTYHQSLGRLSDLSKSDQSISNNITAQLRQIITNQEQLISQNLYEGQTFTIQNGIFNMSITKYSRLANLLYDVSNTDNSFIQYQYPLSTALEPTDRQTFTVINFQKSPFIGSYFLNQSALSNGSVYFSYRDQNGQYLTGDDVLGQIQMAFKYQFSKLIDPYNSTTCGYIRAEDSQWENSSCTVQFDQSNNYIYCSCRHMSYYAIIDDYLIRGYPLQTINFQNYLSIIPFGYMLIIFIFGLIYTYSKDHSDFRTLNKQDDTLGLDLIDGNSVTIKTLLFKRKVFFTGFGDKYSFNTLLRIMIIQLHPFSQLINNFDPEIPRFYKFIALYTRIMIMFGITFYFIREYKDVNDVWHAHDLTITLIKIFVILWGGALLFAPIPSFMYACCRSRYFLIRQRAGQLDFMYDDEKPTSNNTNIKTLGPSLGDQIAKQNKQIKAQFKEKIEQERFTNVKIDSNLPLKLMFLIDRASTDKIIRDYPTSMSYSSGDVKPLSQKLYELDIDINPQQNDQNNQMNYTDYPHYGQSITDNDINEATSRQLKVHQTPKRMKNFDDNDHLEQHQNVQNLQIPHTNNPNDYDSKDQFSAARQSSQYNKYGLNQKPPSSLQLQDGNRPPVNPSDIDCEIGDDEEFKVDQINNGQLPRTPHLGSQDVMSGINEAIKFQSQNRGDDGNASEDLKSSPSQTGRSNIDKMDAATPQRLHTNMNMIRYTDPSNPNTNHHNDKHTMSPMGYGYGLGDFNNQLGQSATNLVIDSFIGSLESQLDAADEKKELVEQSNKCGRLLGNLLALIINIGILVAIFYFYITEEYYMVDNNWIWIVVFFGSQALGFLVFDFFILIIMALCVAKCCKRKKSCLARWMKESLYIYEDYKYIMEFAETKIE